MGFDRSYIPVGLVEPKIWVGKELIPKNAKSILKMDYATIDISDKLAHRAGLSASNSAQRFLHLHMPHAGSLSRTHGD